LASKPADRDPDYSSTLARSAVTTFETGMKRQRRIWTNNDNDLADAIAFALPF
jgi:hypothetical protein